MIKLAIVGAGPNATGHARYHAKHAGVTLVAVADPVSEKAEALAKEVGCRAVPDLSAVLGEVDAVVVASPNFLHHEHALAVAKAGKHLYCEKPMGLDIQQAREITAAVAKAGVASQVGFSPRNSANLHQMALRAKAGEFGRLMSVCSRRLMWMDKSKAAGWRADPAKSGGLLMEINIHELDWMMTVAGPVEWVFAKTWSAKPGHPRANDHVWATLGFTNGACGQHEGSWASPTPNYYRSVQGVDGGACTDEWGSKLFLSKSGSNRVDTEAGENFDLRGNWLQAIQNGGATAADTAWALQVMAVGEAIFASAASGVPVKLADILARSASA